MMEKLQETIDLLWNDYFDLLLLYKSGVKTYGKENWDVESIMLGMLQFLNAFSEAGLKQSDNNQTYNLKRMYESTKKYKDSIIQGEGI